MVRPPIALLTLPQAPGCLHTRCLATVLAGAADWEPMRRERLYAEASLQSRWRTEAMYCEKHEAAGMVSKILLSKILLVRFY